MLKRIDDIEIPTDDPFANDLLKRDTVAENLATLVENTTTPYVMSISAPWGQGKTTFIKMWKQLLENRGFATVYFDAWSSDYANDPLLSFIGSIETSIRQDDTKAQQALGKVKKTFEKVICASPKIALNWALRGGLHYVTDGDANAKDEIDAAAKIAAELVEQEMAQHQTIRELLDDFGKRLSELGASLSEDGKPLVILIDELDRCRPDYAVELLERIKHMFAVENLMIVLSVDIEKLGEAAAKIIGFSSQHSHGYLRRFIDLDYRLPEPTLATLIDTQIYHCDLPNGYYNPDLGKRLACLARYRNLSTRDCLQVIKRLAATANSFPKHSVGIKTIMPFVLMDAYANHELTQKRLSDKETAKQHIQGIQDWSDAIPKNADYDEYVARRWISRAYCSLLFGLAGYYVKDQDKDEFRQWSLDLRGDMDLSKFRELLIDSLDFSKAFS